MILTWKCLKQFCPCFVPLKDGERDDQGRWREEEKREREEEEEAAGPNERKSDKRRRRRATQSDAIERTNERKRSGGEAKGL